MSAGTLGRYRDVARLLTKYETASADPDELVSDLERLGPTFVKLGQLLSSRADLVPREYQDALARLQDDVSPFPYEDAVRVVEEELDVRLHKVFPVFGREPVAAASLAQIHRAELRDGRVVAVKVQRPGIGLQIRNDLDALERAASFLERHTAAGRRYELSLVLSQFRRRLQDELDFEREAANLVRMGDDLVDFDRLLVPQPYDDFTSPRVLTMDFVPGRKVTELTPLHLNEVDGPPLARQLFRAYLKQILVEGFFHADPHPGNIILADDGRLGILDLGMAGRVGPELQQDLLTLLLAISEGRCEDAATAAIRLGDPREDFREAPFRRGVCELVLRNVDSTISEISLGAVIFDIARLSADCGLRLPGELTLIAKVLLNLDQVIASLDPDFSPAQVVRDESAALMRERMARRMTRASISSGLLDLEDFALRLPRRLGKALDVIGNRELRLKVDAFDENLLIQGMQKIANRIALGVVLASLIIGAALMMQVRTRFTILDYPGIAMILFGFAALASFGLILDILYYDEKRRARLRAPPGES